MNIWEQMTDNYESAIELVVKIHAAEITELREALLEAKLSFLKLQDIAVNHLAPMQVHVIARNALVKLKEANADL